MALSHIFANMFQPSYPPFGPLVPNLTLLKFENGRRERSYMKVSTFITFLARKDEQNSNATKLSCVQQAVILLLFTNLCK